MTTYCSRASCLADLEDQTELFCSEECREMHEALERVPKPDRPLHPLCSDAAVRFAFPWLDIRATDPGQAAS